MGELIATHDWSATPLGDIAVWPQSLRTAVALMLASRQPAYMAWGPEQISLYNDGYIPILGAKHPEGLGLPAAELWAEIWDELGPLNDAVLAGEALWFEDRPFALAGRDRDIGWFNFSYTPLRDEDGRVAGIYCAAVETTDRVLGERHKAEERERLARMFEQAPGFITILRGPEHVFEFVNAAYRRLFGDRDYVGQPARQAFPELADQSFFDLLDRVYATGQRFVADRISIRLERSPGAADERFLDFIYEPLTDEAGRVTGIFVEGHDVTDAHRAEAELRANAERQAFWLSLDDRLRDLADPTEAIAAASEALGRHLGVGQVAYAQVESGDETAIIERDWNDGAMAGNRRRHRLEDYGPELIADLRQGKTIAIPDVAFDRRTSSAEAMAAFSQAKIVGLLNVPIIKAGRLVAILGIHSATTRNWSTEESALAAEIAERTWAAAERARAEAELRGAEERYLALFNSIDQGFCTIEVAFDDHDAPVDYRFLEVSPSFERQTGIENGAGRWMREIAADQDQCWFDTYGRVALTGEPARFESYSTPLDRWWDVYAFRISGPRRIAVLFRDISDQKRAEAALRESEARVRALTDNLPAGTVYQIATGVDGRERRFLYVSQSHEKLTGVPAAAVLADATIPYNLILPEDRGRLVEAEAEAIRTRTPFDVEARFRRADGEVRWCRILSAPREQADGSIIWDGIQIDTTDQKTAEATLRELNENLERRVDDVLAERKLLADVFDATGAFIQVIDTDHNLLAINKANADEYERAYGFRPTTGDNLLDMLADFPEQRDVARAHFARALAGETFTITGEFGHPERGPRWYEIKFSPLGGDGGELLGAYHFSLDVTERRREQERLREAEAQLRQSQKMEAIGQLTGGVAHDFNNLLTVICSSADLLRRRELPEEKRRRYIEAISETADRAAKLTGQLLAFARRQALKPEVFDAAKRVDGVADMLRSVLGARIELGIDAVREPCFVEADPGQFEAAIVNLAANARDAMGGEGHLAIRVEPASALPAVRGHAAARGKFIAVSVSDTGTGIAPADRERIFEPFFTTKGIGQGTGLGLSQVLGFAKQSGGEVDVRSEPGHGSTFTLYLPRADALPPEAVGEKKDERADGRGRLLIVEDNATVGEFATQLLKDLGYETELAVSAEEALRLLEGEDRAFDAVFSDVVMPGMGGVELARRLRELRPELPIVLTSGYSHILAEDVHHGFPLLHKPYSVDGLSRILREATAGSGHGAPHPVREG